MGPLFKHAEQVCTPRDPPPDVAPEWHDRFMSKVRRTDIRSCWIWTGVKNEHGYGWFRLDGRYVFAHRFIFEQSGSYIPPGISILHKCDNPSCVNPLHLRMGTQQENNRDRDRKGRVAHGERCALSKLKEHQVLAIRAAVGDVDWLATKCAEFAKEYCVSTSAIYKIITRETWRRL